MSYALDEIRRLERSRAGLIHVGAGFGRDVAAYRQLEVPRVVLVEALDGAFGGLKKEIGDNPTMHPVRALCSSLAGVQSNFYIASNAGVSSSMLKPRRHLIEAPTVEFPLTVKIVTTTLDSVIADLEASSVGFSLGQTDVLIVEVQGAELQVLKGASRTLQRVRYVYATVFSGGLFEKETDFGDLQAFLRCYGFRLNNLALTKHGWGHAFFLR
jgi:FkbM family methyltransferase